jgi:hypothetical protein
MAKHWSQAQPDLFEGPPPGVALAPAERAKALEQLQALLIEAMTTPTDRRETGDDQDHA